MNYEPKESGLNQAWPLPPWRCISAASIPVVHDLVAYCSGTRYLTKMVVWWLAPRFWRCRDSVIFLTHDPRMIANCPVLSQVRNLWTCDQWWWWWYHDSHRTHPYIMCTYFLRVPKWELAISSVSLQNGQTALRSAEQSTKIADKLCIAVRAVLGSDSQDSTMSTSQFEGRTLRDFEEIRNKAAQGSFYCSMVKSARSVGSILKDRTMAEIPFTVMHP